MSFNLYSKLTEIDIKRIENYADTYGVGKENYLGVENHLKYWGREKIKLYKLLGNSFIYKIPIEVNKSEIVLKKEIKNKVLKYTTNSFISKYYAKIYNYISIEDNFKSNDIQEKKELVYLLKLPTQLENLINNSLNHTIKYQKPNEKLLQLQKGTKPMKAIGKIIKYFGWKDLEDSFNTFRTEYSMIFNDKTIKGNLCLSIHPMDMMTLSDNNENWSSCFSMARNSCYQISTTEMLNSNNVIVAYIESSSLWDFNKTPSDKDDESWVWNSKRYRQLVVVTKNIILGGKSYPYTSREITDIVLETIKNLAEKNLNWTYDYGIEPYKDMIHINNKYRMEKTKKRIQNKNTFKHNIIIDTRGAYNDWLNSSSTKFYCYRNKVKKTTMLNISGKSSCLCCGGDVIREEESYKDKYYEGDYNERYVNLGQLICSKCIKEKMTCYSCGKHSKREKYYTFDNKKYYCKDCWEKYLRHCPECRQPFFVRVNKNNTLFVKHLNKEYYLQDIQDYFINNKYENSNKISPMFMCADCINGYKDMSFSETTLHVDKNRPDTKWRKRLTIWLSNDIWSQEEIKNYSYNNLTKVGI